MIGVVFVVEGFLEGEDGFVFVFVYVEIGELLVELLGGIGVVKIVLFEFFGCEDCFEIGVFLGFEVVLFFVIFG